MIYHLLIDVAMGFYARYQITKTICHKNMSLHTSFPVYEKYLKIISISAFEKRKGIAGPLTPSGFIVILEDGSRIERGSLS